MRTLCPVSSIMRKFLRFGRRLLCSSYLAPSDRAYAFSKRTRIVYQKSCLENTHPQRLRALRQNKRPAGRAISPCGSRGLSPQILLSAASGAVTGIGLSIYFRFVPFNSVPSEIQFSIFNPGTFEKCAVLFVTSVKSFALATAAMNMSSEPIGVPAVSSATLMSA